MKFDIKKSTDGTIDVESRETPLKYFRANIYPSKSMAFIYEINIEESLRGKGYGRKVIDSFIDLCKGYGVKILKGIPEKSSQDFWRANNFEVIPRDQKSTHDEDLPYKRNLSPLMVKELSLISYRQADLLERLKPKEITLVYSKENGNINGYYLSPNENSIDPEDAVELGIPFNIIATTEKDVCRVLSLYGLEVINVAYIRKTFVIHIEYPSKKVKADLLPRLKEIKSPNFVGKRVIKIFGNPNAKIFITSQDNNTVVIDNSEIALDLSRYDYWIRDNYLIINYKRTNIGLNVYYTNRPYNPGKITQIREGLVYTDGGQEINPLKVKFIQYEMDGVTLEYIG